MGNLWIFGDSLCLPFNIEAPAWPEILAQDLGLNLCNLAQPSVDNLYIYYSVRGCLKKIQKNDQVIIGWSHPNRKTWIYNPDNQHHRSVLPKSTSWQNHDLQFFRSNRETTLKYIWPKYNMQTQNSNVEYFDLWYDEYFNLAEQKTHLQSFIDSTILFLPHHIKFFFSEESITGIDSHDTKPLYMLDFIKTHGLAISKDDLHPNAQGHQIWAKLLLDRILSKEK